VDWKLWESGEAVSAAEEVFLPSKEGSLWIDVDS
jgi:hypothetical protein